MSIPYTRRYAGGFVDLPTKTTPADSQYLNGVEDALVALLGVAPTTNGALIWDGSEFRADALIKDANVDAAAAIARSKLNFGAGLVDADIAASAAIAQTKLAPLSVDAASQAVSAANTDLAWNGGHSLYAYQGLAVTGTSGTIRSLGVPTPGAGTRITLRQAGVGGTFAIILNNTAGGTGAKFLSATQQNIALGPGDTVEFVYDGTFWVEVSRDSASYQPWTPTLSNSGASLGNATTFGQYVQIGKLVHWYSVINFGSTTNFGSGALLVNTPVPMATGTGQDAMGVAVAISSLSASWISYPGIASGTQIAFSTNVYGTGTGQNITSTVPFTWSSGAILRWSMTYQAA